MGKPTKNDTSSGGDERIVERKHRAGSNPSKASSSTSSNTVKRLGDNETSRLKTGLRQSARQSMSGRGGLKQPTNVTIHTPLKTVPGLGQSTNRASNVTKPTASITNKEVKKTIEIGNKTKNQIDNMKPDSESLEHKTETELQDMACPTEIIKQQAKDSSDDRVAEPQIDQQNGHEEILVEENGTENGNTEENGKTNMQNGDENAPSESDNDVHLHLEDQDSGGKSDNNFLKEPLEIIKENDSQSDAKTSIDETSDNSQSTDPESCSVDVVESTTSELSEATESTAAPSEIKDDESQNANSEDTGLEHSRQCSVKLMDCMKDPQCADLMKEQNTPLASRINTRSKSKSKADDGEVQQSEPEAPKSTYRREIIKPRARPSIRRNFMYQPSNSSSQFHRPTGEAGPSRGPVSNDCRNPILESATTSTNGTSVASKETNIKRKAEDNALNEKKTKFLKSDNHILISNKTEDECKMQGTTSRINTISFGSPPVMKKWCSIM